MFSASIILKTPAVYISNLIFGLWLKDARFKLARIRKYLRLNETILDIGAGPGSVCLLLDEDGYFVTPIDVEDRSLTDEVKPTIYDGITLPFKGGSFDAALILTVLHHTENPRCILLEAKRVAGKIIIIEDIYTNVFQQYLTYTLDSIFNFEFVGHPHGNKSDGEWKELFYELGLTLKDCRYDRFLLFFRQATYYLEK